MHKEVEVLRKHLLGKEGAIQRLCEIDKEYCQNERKVHEKKAIMSQVLFEVDDFELQIKSLSQEVSGYQYRIDKMQENVIHFFVISS